MNSRKTTCLLSLLILATFIHATALVAQTGAAVNVFGPVVYTSTTGGSQQFSATIAAPAGGDCGGRAAYVLSVQSGDSDGRHAVASASLTWNGLNVITESDFAGKPRSIERGIFLLPSNLLKMTLKGGAPGSTLTVSIRRQIESAALPVHPFTLAADSRKLTQSATFNVTDPTRPYVLAIRAGDDAGQHAGASGSVSLNGVQVVRAADLLPPTVTLRVPVALQALNTVAVDLHGLPGDVLSVAVMEQRSESLCGPVIAFTAPAANATVTSRQIIASGTVAASSNVAVTVNGHPAALISSHLGNSSDPFIWSVALQSEPGTVELTAIATDASGSSSTKRSVTLAPSPFAPSLIMTPAAGVAPLPSLVVISEPRPAEVVRYELDLDGDGNYEQSFTSLPEGESFTYKTPGIYRPRVRVTDASGGVTTEETIVEVRSFAEMNTMLKATWNHFAERVAAGDIEGTLQSVTAETRARYRTPLLALRNSLPQIANDLYDLLPVSIDAASAHYLLRVKGDGHTRGFHVYFARDSDGIWRVLQF